MAKDGETPSESVGKKKVDESWKDAIWREKEAQSENLKGAAEELPPLEAGFPALVSTLGMQTLVALGAVKDPHGRAPQADLGQAQYLIDTLQMLAQKTRGNLTPEEETMLTDLLYELRMQFVKKSAGEPQTP